MRFGPLIGDLNLRSESMASVYSQGEGRYGTVAVRGDVEFGFIYNFGSGSLDISIKQCKDLAPVDLKRNRSDPWVFLTLIKIVKNFNNTETVKLFDRGQQKKVAQSGFLQSFMKMGIKVKLLTKITIVHGRLAILRIIMYRILASDKLWGRPREQIWILAGYVEIHLHTLFMGSWRVVCFCCATTPCLTSYLIVNIGRRDNTPFSWSGWLRTGRLMYCYNLKIDLALFLFLCFHENTPHQDRHI